MDDPGIKSGISVHELNSTSEKKKKKSIGGERLVEHSPQILASEERVAIMLILTFLKLQTAGNHGTSQSPWIPVLSYPF